MALRMNVDAIEVDVQQTSDGHLIVLHDRHLHPSTTGRGNVADFPLDEIRDLRTTPGDQPIPTLHEVLACVNGKAGLMLELKAPGIANEVAAAVRQSGFAGPVYYASFFHEEMLAIRDADAGAATIVLFQGTPVNLTSFATDARASHAGLSIESLSPHFVAKLHEAGVQVFTYTVDEPEEIEFARACGVNGLISDFPDRL
jgi:glycerophosphoryl diester phosphodiesterase